MRAIRQAVLILVFVALGGCWAQSALADDAAALYDPSKMYVFKLDLSADAKKALENPEEWQEYQEGGKFSWAVSSNGVPPSPGSFSTPENVEIRLKGNYSFRNLTAKSAFKVKFPKTKLFKDVRVLTLNNMVNDPSMIRETLAYTAYRAAAVPASRTGYAYVYVNGVDYGIHLNIETMDKIALEKLFGKDKVQHLYEGEDGADVHPSVGWKFEVDEGDKVDLSDLDALIATVNSSGPQPWAQRVAAVADLAEMTRMWAAEKYLGQWDGYAGQEESWTPNNYYLYSDPKGVFQMLPWGNDESMQAHNPLTFDGAAGLMFDLCLADAACRVLYRESVAAVRDAIVGASLDSLAVDSAAMLAPWQAKEVKESTREEWGLEQIEDGVAEVRSLLAARPVEVAEWLADEKEGGSEEEAGGGEKTPQGQPSPATVQTGEPAGLPVQGRLRLGKVQIARGVLSTRASLWSSGTVIQKAKVSTGQGAKVICSDRTRVERPEVVALRCRLPASILDRLRTGSLGITLATRFIPASGRPENLSRWLVLPRA
jgi:CotH kinase protein